MPTEQTEQTPSKIGQTVYIFDQNRRVYPKREDGGTISSRPIWREHWRPVKIVGETSRSWVTERDGKIAKSAKASGSFAWTQADIDEAEFVHEHRYRIASLVGRLDDAGTLRKVAALIGYEVTPE